MPYRHTRDKALLLLDGATPGQADSVLRTLIAHDPRPVLDALIAVLEGEPGEGEVPQCQTVSPGARQRRQAT